MKNKYINLNSFYNNFDGSMLIHGVVQLGGKLKCVSITIYGNGSCLRRRLIKKGRCSMEQNVQTAKNRGGRRPGAGRPPGKIKRNHRTIWVSEEEYRQVKDLLFEIQQYDPAE